jgi:hypothetical protein
MAITLKYRLNEASGTSVSDSVGTNTWTATAVYPVVDWISWLARDWTSWNFQIQAASGVTLTTRAWSCRSKLSWSVPSAQRMISMYPWWTHNDYIRTNNWTNIIAWNSFIEAVYTMTVNDWNRHYYYAYNTPTSVDLYVDWIKRATATGTWATGTWSFSVSWHRWPWEYFKGAVDEVNIYDWHIWDWMVNNMNLFFRWFM